MLAKFTADGCNLCAALAPSVAQFATEPEFAGIKFLRLDAAENPGARHLMNERAAPFFCQLLSGPHPASAPRAARPRKCMRNSSACAP